MALRDRIVATDRAVAAYRRFTGSDFDSAAPLLIADLLHWHARFVNDEEDMHALLNAALKSYSGDVDGLCTCALCVAERREQSRGR